MTKNALDRYRIREGEAWRLGDFDPHDTGENDKHETKKRHRENVDALKALQQRLYAEGERSLLVVFQALDAGGKDGTIRHVFGPINPQGCRVTSFKVPSSLEKGHDFLWRIHAAAPSAGMMSVFNRSHYESVLIEAVHGWVDERTVDRRFGYIRAFEELLSDRGTKILKFFLYIDKEEQKKRFQDRLDVPEKNWKFSRGDLAERSLFDAYLKQFERVLTATSTPSCPWYVVPAGAKWYRNWVVSSVVREHLESMDLRFPPPEAGLEDVVIE